ncbi:MAG: isoprenyl transferase [Candidatus Hydrothermales bacterium]
MKIPEHVAIVMDGNGRWAKERNLPRLLGHKEGVESVREIIKAARELGIKYLTLFTFSTENWKRSEEEIKGLFNLLESVARKELKNLIENGIRVMVMGRIDELPESTKKVIEEVIEKTKENKDMVLILAINYGGKREVIDAVNKILKNGKKEINEEDFRKYLYIPDIPDPDLLIRTSGEMRISNFFLFQLSYTELYFTKKNWPEFRREDFLNAIEEYSKRVRRFGEVIP